MTTLPERLRASAQKMRTLDPILICAARIARELEEAAGALEARRGSMQPEDWAVFSFLEMIRDDLSVPAKQRQHAAKLHSQFADPSAQVAQEGGGVEGKTYG